MLDAMTGEHPRDPISLPRHRRALALRLRLSGCRSGLPSRGIWGARRLIRKLRGFVKKQRVGSESLGVKVEEAHPDFHDVQDIFQALRAEGFYMTKQKLLEEHRDKMKPEVIWNIEKALEYTIADFTRVQLARGAYIQRAVDFFETYDLLLSPATCVAPYPVEQRYVAECDGHKFDHVEWLTIAYAITLTTFPALVAACRFHFRRPAGRFAGRCGTARRGSPVIGFPLAGNCSRSGRFGAD